MGVPEKKERELIQLYTSSFQSITLTMLRFGVVFHTWIVFWTCLYVGSALEVPNFVSGWRKHRRASIVVFVDPLDDFGATSEVRATCAALGLRVVNMWSPQVARKLLSYLEQMSEDDTDGTNNAGPVVSMELAGVSVDIQDILDGTYTAPLLYQDDVESDAFMTMESTDDDDRSDKDTSTPTPSTSDNHASSKTKTTQNDNQDSRYAHAGDQALAWLTHQGINVTEVVGVVCESDVGLRTAEEFAASLRLPTANPRCEVHPYDMI